LIRTANVQNVANIAVVAVDVVVTHGLTAGLREQFAETAKYAANSANAALFSQ
jgi:hypothetical protein